MVRNRGVAIGLCFLLGGVGAHRFYLGRPWSGVFYGLLCWTLIPCIMALCETVALLGLSEEDFSWKYNSKKCLGGGA